MPRGDEKRILNEDDLVDRIGDRVEARLRTDLGDRIDKRYTDIRDRFYEVGGDYAEQVKQELRSEIAAAVQKELKWRERIVLAFVAGFLLFVTLGFLQRDFFFKPMHNVIYPPDVIYSEIEPSFQQLEISKIPKVKNELPKHVWTTLQTGNKQEFELVLKNSEFYNSLKQHFWEEMNVRFPQTHLARIDPRTVMEYGKVPQDGTLNVIDRKWDGKPTECGRRLDHSRHQVIVALPRKLDAPAFGWLGCGSNYPMITSLRITVPGNEIDGVELVGVERNKVRGKTPEIRVTQATAVALGISGASRWTGKAHGRFSVADASN